MSLLHSLINLAFKSFGFNLRWRIFLNCCRIKIRRETWEGFSLLLLGRLTQKKSLNHYCVNKWLSSREERENRKTSAQRAFHLRVKPVSVWQSRIRSITWNSLTSQREPSLIDWRAWAISRRFKNEVSPPSSEMGNGSCLKVVIYSIREGSCPGWNIWVRIP